MSRTVTNCRMIYYKDKICGKANIWQMVFHPQNARQYVFPPIKYPPPPPQRKYVFLWNQTGTGWMYFLSECIIEWTYEVVQTRYISFWRTFGIVQNECLHSHSSSEAWIFLCRLGPIPPKGHCLAWEDPEKSGMIFLRQLSSHSQRYWQKCFKINVGRACNWKELWLD